MDRIADDVSFFAREFLGTDPLDSIRVKIRTGWTCGSLGFAKQAEALIGRPAKRDKRGRKPRTDRRVRP
jgi:hypothetical protein